MRDCIPIDEKLSAVLRFLATGESYRSLQYHTQISLSLLSRLIPEVCKVLYDELKHKYLAFPKNQQEWRRKSENVCLRWHFPLCLGALDGKHIAFRASLKDGPLYYNYKGFNSIIPLALCDADYKFTYIDIGSNDRNNDAGVLNKSNLRNVLDKASITFPEDTEIGNNRKLPYVIVADDAFPFHSKLKCEKNVIYNKHHSHARHTIEHAFGMLANKFRVLMTTIRLLTEKVSEVVQSSCALHNFVIEANLPTPPTTPTVLTSPNSKREATQSNNVRTRIGPVIRDEFCRLLCERRNDTMAIQLLRYL